MSIKAFIFTVAVTIVVQFGVSQGGNQEPLEIFFVANTNALLENCHCGNPSLGGLARITTIVKKEREKNPRLIFIDGGDFLNAYPFKEINNTVLDIYDSLKPDIIVPGENEFVDGIPLIKSFLENNSYKTLCSNYKIDHIKTTDYVKIEGLFFVSYLDNAVFLNGFPNELSFNDSHFEKLYNQLKNKYLVVIYHGYYGDLNNFINSHPKVDLILAAHNKAGVLDTPSGITAIGSGTDGEYIIKINIDNKRVKKTELIAVSLDVKQDQNALNYINKFKTEERLRRSEGKN